MIRFIIGVLVGAWLFGMVSQHKVSPLFNGEDLKVCFISLGKTCPAFLPNVDF
jgi:hypothetical protein